MASALAALICILPFSTCSEPRGWGFVQSVGGMAIGTAVERQGGWFLPVQANVSGTESITVKPSMLNSGLICESVSAKVVGDTILLTLNTGLVRDGYSPRCPEAALGTPPAGEYRVLYTYGDSEPQALGSIMIGSSGN